jgi:hypothetical protein
LFIVGSPRSGTSILVDVVFAAGFKGFREGNLLGLLKPLYDRIDHHFRVFGTDNPMTLMGHVRQGTLRVETLGIFRRVLESYNPIHPWLDKTCNPEAILVLPDLVETWPDCRIIFAKRRGIENIASRLKKFPGRDFTYHCEDWARNMSAWRRIRNGLDAWRYLELDQRALILWPEEVAAALADFLRLGPPEQQKMVRTLRTGRPQQTAEGTAERVTSLREIPWTDQQKEEFVRICGPEMGVFGYSLDGNYWEPGADSVGHEIGGTA